MQCVSVAAVVMQPMQCVSAAAASWRLLQLIAAVAAAAMQPLQCVAVAAAYTAKTMALTEDQIVVFIICAYLTPLYSVNRQH